MGRIPKPSEINNLLNNEPMEKFLVQVIKGDVVLVLGHENVLKDELCGGNVRKYLENDFFSYKNDQNPNLHLPYNTFDEYYYQGADLEKMKRDIVKSLSPEQYCFNIEELSTNLVKLLETKYFRLVLTTTYDQYIETVMRNIWGENLRVLNIFDIGNKFDLEKEELENKHLIRPTLYYIFGRANEDSDFAVIENDYMKVIKKWLGEKAPNNLLTYIRNKSILLLGTKFDDWLFRFFWFALHGDNRSRFNGRHGDIPMNGHLNGTVAISFNKESETDRKLEKYLNREDIRHERNTCEMINYLLDNLDKAERQYRKENCKLGDIFLSYDSSSYDTVRHLFYYLISKGYKVWFDRHPDVKQGIAPGDSYDRNIRRAIGQCQIFIPIIGQSIKEILTENDKSFHYFRNVEWKLAQSRYNVNSEHDKMEVIPYCIDGIDLKDVHPHAEQEEQFAFISSKSAANSYTQENLNKFIVTINQILKKL